MAEENAKAQVVDLDSIDSSLVEESISIDVTANPMEAPPPVSDGIHRVKLTGGKDWNQAETKENKAGNKTTYLSTKFRGQVMAEGSKDNNKLVFKNFLSTLTFEGKNEMAYILIKIYGDNAEAKARVEAIKKPDVLAKAFRDALAGEPIIRVKTKWTARYNAGTKEKPDYKTAMSGQSTFPKNPDGSFKHVIQVKDVGEVAAGAEITDYFADVVS